MKASSLPDIELARFNMVEQQLRPWDISDPALLESLITLRRELFVPPAYRALAFTDMEVPLVIQSTDTHQFMLSPLLEAMVTQRLQLKPDDCVLEIGTGSGYQAALLGSLAREVTSIEIDPRLVAFARAALTIRPRYPEPCPVRVLRSCHLGAGAPPPLPPANKQRTGDNANPPPPPMSVRPTPPPPPPKKEG